MSLVSNMIKEISLEENIQMESFFNDYGIRLTKGSISRYIYGSRFDLNSCATDNIVNDKSMASSIMRVS